MEKIDLNLSPKSGIFYKGQVTGIPRCTFTHTHVQIMDHPDIQVCFLINVSESKQRMFYRRKFKDGGFGVFREVISSREVK